MSSYVRAESIEQVVEVHVGSRVMVGNHEFRFDGCGSRFQSPRPLSLLSVCSSRRIETSFEQVAAMVAAGEVTLWIEQVECSGDPAECRGDVEYRFTGNGLRARPLCERHQEDALRVSERATAYLSDVAPAWFDPSYAGERWGEDD